MTVIATGLDSEDARRTPPEPRRRVPDPIEDIERERAMVDPPNVRPIREQPAVAQAEPAPPAPAEPVVEQPVAAAAAQSADEIAVSGLGFESPFEDELDTPAFLRRRSSGGDDRDVPDFMRRGGSGD